uniref:BTB domain-containing protein n=1 Tax=Parastrongyloides trichosuri TaxID=131310 RepID=A0A0N5A1I0_PARTI
MRHHLESPSVEGGIQKLKDNIIFEGVISTPLNKGENNLVNDLVFYFTNDCRYLPCIAAAFVSRSRFFAKQLSEYGKKSYSMNMPEVSFDSMMTMKKFLYSDAESYVMTTKRLMYHMECLGIFDCDLSKNLCIDYIGRNLKPRDYFKAYEISLVSDPVFKEILEEKIVEDFYEVIDYNPLKGLSHHAIYALLRSSIKNVLSHMCLFKVIMQWADDLKGMITGEELNKLFCCLDISEFGFGLSKEGILRVGDDLLNDDILNDKYKELKIPEFKNTLKNKKYFNLKDSLAFVSGGYIHSADKAFIFNGLYKKVEHFFTMPYCRSRHTSSLIDNKIFIIGGHDENMMPKSTAFCYDIATQYFSEEFDLLQGARSYHSSVRINDNIYIIGGYGSNVVNTIEIYNAIKPEVVRIQKVNFDDACHDSFYINNGIYITPGKKSPSMRLYDDREGKLTQLCRIEPHIYLSGYCSEPNSSEIYGFGGRLSDCRTATSYVYDVRANKFRNICDLEIAIPDAKTYLYDNNIFIFGGYAIPLPREGPELFTKYNPTSSVQIYNLRKDVYEVSPVKLVSYTNGYGLTSF